MDDTISLKWHNKRIEDDVQTIIGTLEELREEDLIKDDAMKKKFVDWLLYLLEEIEAEYKGKESPRLTKQYTTQQVDQWLAKVAHFMLNEHQSELEAQLCQGFPEKDIAAAKKKISRAFENMLRQNPPSSIGKPYSGRTYFELLFFPYLSSQSLVHLYQTTSAGRLNIKALVDNNIFKQLFLDQFPKERERYRPLVANFMIAKLQNQKYVTQTVLLELWRWPGLKEKFKRNELKRPDNKSGSALSYLHNTTFDKSYGTNPLDPKHFNENNNRFKWQRSYYKNYIAAAFEFPKMDSKLFDGLIIAWFERKLRDAHANKAPESVAELVAIFFHVALYHKRRSVEKDLKMKEEELRRYGKLVKPKTLDDFEANLYTDLQILFIASMNLFLNGSEKRFNIYTDDTDFPTMKKFISEQATNLNQLNQEFLITKFLDRIVKDLRNVNIRGTKGKDGQPSPIEADNKRLRVIKVA